MTDKNKKTVKQKKIKINKKKKPRFTVMNEDHVKRIGHRWRKPRGIDNKKRVRFAYTGKSPRVGYGNQVGVRGMHPCGLAEVLVHNPKELESVKEKAIRIASSVGERKRNGIREKAKTLGLHVLN